MKIVVAIEASEKIDKNLFSADVVIFEANHGTYFYYSQQSLGCNITAFSSDIKKAIPHNGDKILIEQAQICHKHILLTPLTTSDFL